MNLQNFLAIKAWVISLNFLIPSPPSFLGLQMVSQLIRWSFLTDGWWPQQKALMMESSLVHILSGILRQENE